LLVTSHLTCTSCMAWSPRLAPLGLSEVSGRQVKRDGIARCLLWVPHPTEVESTHVKTPIRCFAAAACLVVGPLRRQSRSAWDRHPKPSKKICANRGNGGSARSLVSLKPHPPAVRGHDEGDPTTSRRALRCPCRKSPFMTDFNADDDTDKPREVGTGINPVAETVDDLAPVVLRGPASSVAPSRFDADLANEPGMSTIDEDQLLFATRGVPEWVQAVQSDKGGDATAVVDAPGLDAFFIANHRRISRKLAVLFSGDISHAEDVMQEAFILAYRHWPQISQLANPYGYVATIAWRLGLRWLRKQRRERERCAQQVALACTADLAPGVGLRLDLQRALDRLPEQQQMVVGLSMLGYGPQEIGEILGIVPGTVRSRLHRARGNLERFLDEAGDPQDETGQEADA
jgi:RNA polymerase sigma-70 factor, ECF subfamily